MSTSRVADPQPFEVRGSPIQGRGGFATRPIASGECIVEYVGERISWKEADLRYDDSAMSRHHTFLFSVTSRTCIDAAVGGNDSRFINHSCDPNCEAVDESSRIFIYAKRDIAEGEELTYDYAYDRDPAYTDEEEALYVCGCGSPNCRGTILAPKKEPAPKRGSSAGPPLEAKKSERRGTTRAKGGVKRGAKRGAKKRGAKRSAKRGVRGERTTGRSKAR